MNTFTAKTIIGLGNNSPQYANTWHNLGMQFVDYLLESNKMDWSKLNHPREPYVYRSVQGVILCKPNTYMNLAGNAVADLVKYLGLESREICLVYDDLDIAVGEYKLQFAKQPKAHNGVNSVIQSLGTAEFWNLRLGCFTDYTRQTGGEEFVLSKIPQAIKPILEEEFASIKEELGI